MPIETTVGLSVANPGPSDFHCRHGEFVGSRVVQLDDNSVTAFPERVVRSSGDGSRVLFANLDETMLTVRDADTLAPVAPAFPSLGADTSQGSVENVYTLDFDGRRVAGTNSGSSSSATAEMPMR